MRKSKLSEAGYSIVEVIVSLGVVSVFAAGAFNTMFTSATIQQSSTETMTASQVLQNEIENLRGMRWSEVKEINLDDLSLDPNYDETYGEDSPLARTDFTLTRTISNEGEDMKKVTFTVTWTSHNGRERELSSSTVLYAKEGLSDSYYKTYQ